jgi:hypothetical protein
MDVIVNVTSLTWYLRVMELNAPGAEVPPALTPSRSEQDAQECNRSFRPSIAWSGRPAPEPGAQLLAHRPQARRRPERRRRQGPSGRSAPLTPPSTGLSPASDGRTVTCRRRIPGPAVIRPPKKSVGRPRRATRTAVSGASGTQQATTQRQEARVQPGPGARAAGFQTRARARGPAAAARGPRRLVGVQGGTLCLWLIPKL